MKYKKALFLFRRDLRVEDNTGLIYALQNAEKVISAFIFTPEQIEHNPYRSDPCLRFMLESLKDLAEQIEKKKGRLYLFHGKCEEIVSQCIKTLHIDAVIVNRDYTPYSIQRDLKIEALCKRSKIDFISFDDLLLHPPETVKKANGTPYTVFTPFFRNASKKKVLNPVFNRSTNYFSQPISFAKPLSYLSKIMPKKAATQALKGGRSEAIPILKSLSKFQKYHQLRDFPAEEGITHLSPYLKFNVFSCREVYAAICHHLHSHHDLIRSLYWRDFFTGIAYFFPHVLQGAFHQKFDRLKWSYDRKAFKKWCDGKTGFPIVDAGMRELNLTGFMHNRVRMIAASFLVKDLHIDWRWGEKYFAQHLIDYDPAVNNGNWQWVASTGCDAQPYFRIFNPWNQQKKFDPDCIYIKQWISELKDLAPKVIHSWDDSSKRPSSLYPDPMVDHAIEAEKAKKSFSSVRQKIKK